MSAKNTDQSSSGLRHNIHFQLLSSANIHARSNSHSNTSRSFLVNKKISYKKSEDQTLIQFGTKELFAKKAAQLLQTEAFTQFTVISNRTKILTASLLFQEEICRKVQRGVTQ
ncbi:hypothetical protein ACFX13_000680 [Malus domestica]